MTGPVSVPTAEAAKRPSGGKQAAAWRNRRAAWTAGWARVRTGLRVARHRFWNHKVAATHVVFFIVAAAIFVPVTVGLFLYTRDLASSQKDGAAGLDSRASAALQEITNSPGLNAAGTSTKWEEGPTIDSVQRVGLRSESSSSLSYAKIDNLQRGGLAAQSDAFLNYEEMRDSLHIGNKYDFHVRMTPVPETRTSDPYGSYAIRGTHVAYFAALTPPASGPHRIDGNGEFEGFTATAQKEIQALLALQLGTSNVNQGFDGKSYQPPAIGASYLLSDPYSNVDTAKQGDVIATTQRYYQSASPLPGGTNQTYPEWFFETYFKTGPATYRYDVLVFGTGVDLNVWGVVPGSTPNKELTDFVKAGGTVIFLNNQGGPANFIVDCTTADCALFTTGTGQPVTTPDITNQIATTPNKLPITSYTTSAKWLVCNEATHDERKGFIPVWLDTLEGQLGDTAECHDLLLGMTSSDRFGATGGTIIFSSIDASSFVSSSDMAPYLANLLNYAVLRPLYLDYGREIPKDEPVSAASRVMSIELPSGSSRDVKMVFYLWHRA